MNHLIPETPRRSHARLLLGLAWTIWMVFGAAAVLTRLDTPPHPGSVIQVYQTAGARILAGEDLYGDGRFLYLPSAAVALVPLAKISFVAAGVVWRITAILVMAVGLRRFCTFTATRCRPSLTEGALFLLTTGTSIFMCWSAARRGQMTLVMCGVMLAALADLGLQKRGRAAILLALAVALKPLALVPAVTVFGLYAIRGRLLLACGLLLGTPVLLQGTAYTLRQYAALPGLAEHTAGRAGTFPFSNLYGILEAFGAGVPAGSVLVLSVLGAGLTFLLCVRAGESSLGLETSIYIFSVSFILLFSPTTERDTFALMGPAFGLLLAHAAVHNLVERQAFILLLAMVHWLSRGPWQWFPGTPLAMLRPMACLALVVVAALSRVARPSPAIDSPEPAGRRRRPDTADRRGRFAPQDA